MSPIIHEFHSGGEPFTYEYRFPVEKEQFSELENLFVFFDSEKLTEELIEQHRFKKTEQLLYHLSKSTAKLLRDFKAKAVVIHDQQWGIKLERKENRERKERWLLDRQILSTNLNVIRFLHLFWSF